MKGKEKLIIAGIGVAVAAYTGLLDEPLSAVRGLLARSSDPGECISAFPGGNRKVGEIHPGDESKCVDPDGPGGESARWQVR